MIAFRLVFLPSVALAFPFDVFEPVLRNLSKSSDIQCQKEGVIFQRALDNGSYWAVRMWDASTKTPNGWLFGNQAQFGNFDECLSTESPFPVQFCLGRVAILRNFDEKLTKKIHEKNRIFISRGEFLAGFCVPASCNVDVLGFRHHDWLINFRDEFCTRNDVEEISSGEIGFWLVSGVLFFTVISATFLDVYFGKSDWILVKFSSLRVNFKELIAAPKKEKDPLSIMHGLRVAAVVLVLYAHRLGIPLSFSGFNHEIWERNLQSLLFRFSAQADMTVDTFFVISGILMGFFSTSFNPISAILNRIFRLSPVYLWVIWLEAVVMPRIGSGPLWNAVQKSESANCVDNWWLNAIFLQNYIREDKMCLTHTWYIPCEIHFFILALILKYIVQVNKTTGITLTNFLMIFAVIVPGFVTWSLNLDPLVLFYLPDFLGDPRSNKSFLEVYAKSHNRLGVYLIGFLGGLYLRKKESEPRKQNWKKSLGLFVAALIMFSVPMVYGIRFYDPSSFRFSWEPAVFTTLRRPFWALGVWFLILSHRAHPIPIVGNVLSCRAAIVLSRLSYGLYLIHFPIIMANMAKMRSAPVFNWFDVIFSGDLASSLVFSTLMFLFIETPIRKFLSLFFYICYSKKKNNLTSLNVENSRK